jgi:DNA polymerase-3 subunit alpha
MDFCSRITGANKKVIESLIRSGAFDFTGMHRARLFNGIDTAMGRAAEILRDKASGQCSMFDLMEANGTSGGTNDEELPDVPPWSESDMLAAEKELIGFYISGHPLARYEWELDKFALKRMRDIDDLKHKDRTRVGGMLVDVRKRFTRRDQKPYATFRIEGLEGSVNAILFSSAFEEYGHLVEEDAAVMVGGIMMDDDNNERKLRVVEIYPLSQAASLFCERVGIHLPEMGITDYLMNSLKTAIAEYRGSTPLTFCIEFVDGPKVFINSAHDYKVRPCAGLEKTIAQAIGDGLVYVAAKPDPLRNPPKERKWKQKSHSRSTTA